MSSVKSSTGYESASSCFYPGDDMVQVNENTGIPQGQPSHAPCLMQRPTHTLAHIHRYTIPFRYHHIPLPSPHDNNYCTSRQSNNLSIPLVPTKQLGGVPPLCDLILGQQHECKLYIRGGASCDIECDRLTVSTFKVGMSSHATFIANVFMCPTQWSS